MLCGTIFDAKKKNVLKVTFSASFSKEKKFGKSILESDLNQKIVIQNQNVQFVSALFLYYSLISFVVPLKWNRYSYRTCNYHYCHIAIGSLQATNIDYSMWKSASRVVCRSPFVSTWLFQIDYLFIVLILNRSNDVSVNVWSCLKFLGWLETYADSERKCCIFDLICDVGGVSKQTHA